MYHHKVRIVYFLFLLAFLVIMGRLVYLQVFSANLETYAKEQHEAFLKLSPMRGSIFDRNGVPLAMSRRVYTAKLVPHEVHDKEETVQKLHELLGLEPQVILEKMSSVRKAVYLKRHIDDDLHQKLVDAHIRGLHFDRESERYYPKGSLAVHTVGFVGYDDQGLEGVEAFFNDNLNGDPGYRAYAKDGKERELLALKRQVVIPKDGDDVVLALDERFQYIAEKEVDEVYTTFKPKAIMVVILDPRTGEVLSLVNRPAFDPNHYGQSNDEQRRNRLITDIFEPGSTFKIMTIAGALNDNIVTPEDKIFCENGRYVVKGRRRPLHDHRPHGMLTVSQVLQKSSNIGTAKIAQKMGAQRLYDYIRAFGFGKKSGIQFPGEVEGIVRPLSSWSEVSIVAVPMGQEVGVTCLQMVLSMAAIANRGVLMSPLLVKELRQKDGKMVAQFAPRPVGRVVDEDVALTVTEMLEGVVSQEGTALKASIGGVRVAGKTGTAQKFDKETRQYSNTKYLASFIGFFPADNPQFCMGVFVDEPPYGVRYGGVVAAPLFSRIGQDLLFDLNHRKEIHDMALSAQQ